MSKRMALATVVVVAIIVQIVLIVRHGNSPPTIGDALENHNIAWSLAHGRGYAFDWDDVSWRRQVAGSSGPALVPREILARHGSGPTASRPPLVPVMGSIIVRLLPGRSFIAMRALEAALVVLTAWLASWVALKMAGPLAAAIAGGLCAIDPLRMSVAPGVWMTENVSAFLVTVLIALLTLILHRHRPLLLVALGVTIGLLVLARSSFILLLPGFVALSAYSWNLGGEGATWPVRRSSFLAAAAVLMVGCLVAMPWWVRNCNVLQAFMPLGTQGGFNLPDEYSDAAIEASGVWSGLGMRREWARRWNDPNLQPYLGDGGFPSEGVLASLWPGGDRGFGWMIYGLTSGHILLERELARTGQAAAIDWIADHPAHVPRLMIAKLVSEVKPVWYWLVPPLLAALFSLRRTARGPLVLMLWILLGLGVLAIMLTHSVSGRFLVPYTPALYLLGGVGIAGGGRQMNAREVASQG